MSTKKKPKSPRPLAPYSFRSHMVAGYPPSTGGWQPTLRVIGLRESHPFLLSSDGTWYELVQDSPSHTVFSLLNPPRPLPFLSISVKDPPFKSPPAARTLFFRCQWCRVPAVHRRVATGLTRNWCSFHSNPELATYVGISFDSWSLELFKRTCVCLVTRLRRSDSRICGPPGPPTHTLTE